MRFSSAFNSCWVLYVMSQLLAAAQRCSNFVRIILLLCDVPNKAIIWALPVIFSIPRYSCHFAKAFETVPRAPITNGTTTTSTWCIHPTSKANSWYRSIFKPQSSQYSSHRAQQHQPVGTGAYLSKRELCLACCVVRICQ